MAALRIAVFALWPFGKTVVRRADAGAGTAIGNVLWFPLAGWWLIVGHIVTGVLLCLTIIGVPLGLSNFKLIPVTFRPFGRDIVSIEEAERQGLSRQITMLRPRRDLSKVPPLASRWADFSGPPARRARSDGSRAQ